ncbi:hypothetical protein ILUMI_13260 [Ignelater luminosus]|uniref:CDT1 Geminin-binding domain-containing protein n=1 Tax=Ignelater luminosus TaxID=2038154 RepID=A0A8K0CUV3_IGNLU|nr:hypothetical protein ILUMI_13260 [Ignelater luminosus]
MSQPSIANYFNTRKRPAVDQANINRARKVLLLDGDDTPKKVVRNLAETTTKSDTLNNNIKVDTNIKSSIVLENKKINSPSSIVKKKIASVARIKKTSGVTKLGNIEELLNNMGRNKVEEDVSSDNNTHVVAEPVTPTKEAQCIPEPDAPKKLNAMDKIKLSGKEPTLAELKHKLSRSERLADLKASLARFKQAEKRLEVAEKKTQQLKESPSLKNFKAIELEVNVSPQKTQSPEKLYLSPKKESKARKNLFGVLSPIKNAMSMPATSLKEAVVPVKESLTLPYKYRCLAEIFRAIDTVSQIMYNRKETITLKKLKPAVEEMLKRNLTEKHLGQMKSLYPDAFNYQREKLREFGSGTRREHWELVVTPNVEQQSITSEILLQRRRKLFKILIEKLKVYHKEFLATLDPPIEVNHEKIARWHPEFDIERVPDIEVSDLPEPPNEEKFTTGSQVLDKARAMFNCNTRMERALEKLKQSRETQTPPKSVLESGSILKGIPKALLEKVRQRQAAKAFESMTRSADKEKEAQLYAKLPEVAGLARYLFVSEKKNTLPLELVLDKLCNSYRLFTNQKEMETYLKTIEKEVGGWLTFYEKTGCVYVKLDRAADLSLVKNKLQNLANKKMSV